MYVVPSIQVKFQEGRPGSAPARPLVEIGSLRIFTQVDSAVVNVDFYGSDAANLRGQRQISHSVYRRKRCKYASNVTTP